MGDLGEGSKFPSSVSADFLGFGGITYMFGSRGFTWDTLYSGSAVLCARSPVDPSAAVVPGSKFEVEMEPSSRAVIFVVLSPSRYWEHVQVADPELIQAYRCPIHSQYPGYIPNSGMNNMIDTDKIQSLIMMYKLFKRVATGIPSMRKAYKESIIRRGSKINLTGEFGVTEELAGREGDPKGKDKAKLRAIGAQTLQ